jgi:hypothetical protein
MPKILAVKCMGVSCGRQKTGEKKTASEYVLGTYFCYKNKSVGSSNAALPSFATPNHISASQLLRAKRGR